MTFRPKNTQERVLHRLKITRGHLSKVIDMVENGEYCIDVIHQSQAVQRALKEADGLLLEYHLRTCVADQIKKGQRDKAVLEVVKVFEKKS
ncbi:MAG: hypothetical protein A3H88_03240 [Candidatus Blackburnbacteria bacterium RIFCSPLOWO2_02_FULL_44_9]|nr:MAG: hypothetical protein A3H88_03240 [Candidatus Blackburnbacteria bacterium RIFCSPLOWO2_02_FULL_44_9]